MDGEKLVFPFLSLFVQDLLWIAALQVMNIQRKADTFSAAVLGAGCHALEAPPEVTTRRPPV